MERKRTKWTDEVLDGIADDLLAWCDDPDNIFLGKFAKKYGINREYLHRFAKRHKKFRQAYRVAKQHQENVLVEGGLLGAFDKTFAIFTLKNVSKWRDQIDTKNDHKVHGNITVNIVSYADKNGPKPKK